MPKVSNWSTARKARRSKRSSSVYRVRNWAAYDQALKVRQHGWSVRRTWRWLHLGINEASGEIVAETLTSNSIDDASQVEPLLEQMEDEIETLGGDGGYDKHKVFQAVAEPPQAFAG